MSSVDADADAAAGSGAERSGAEEPERPLDAARLSAGLIDCYFGGRRSGNQLVKHQLDSFNDFVSRKLEQIIEGFNTVDVCNTFLPEHGCYKYVLSLSLQNPVISKPLIHEKDGSTKVMLPNDARLRNLTYAAPLLVDLHVAAKVFVPDMGIYTCETKKIRLGGEPPRTPLKGQAPLKPLP